MYERVNVNCARENSTGDWESGIHNFIFQLPQIHLFLIDFYRAKCYNLTNIIGRKGHGVVNSTIKSRRNGKWVSGWLIAVAFFGDSHKWPLICNGG